MAPSQPEISLVMVIDDHIEEIAKIESLVSAEVPGCVFLRETSIKKALEDLRTKQPKLVVMEAHLKDGDASELLQAFPHKDRSFPCLIITRDKSEETLKQMFELGADDLLVKPVDELIFQSKVRSMLSQQYISPLSFLGLQEGLADLNFQTDIDLVELNEETATFISAVPVAKTGVVVLEVGGSTVPLIILSMEPTPNNKNLFLMKATVGPLLEPQSRALRRLLVELSSGHALAATENP